MLGDAKPGGRASSRAQTSSDMTGGQGSHGGSPSRVASPSPAADLAALTKRADRLRDFERGLAAEGLGGSYAAAHARLAAASVAAAGLRRHLIEEGSIKPLPSPRETAADSTYITAASKLCDGLETVLTGYEKADSRQQRKIYEVWVKTAR